MSIPSQILTLQCALQRFVTVGLIYPSGLDEIAVMATRANTLLSDELVAASMINTKILKMNGCDMFNYMPVVKGGYSLKNHMFTRKN